VSAPSPMSLRPMPLVALLCLAFVVGACGSELEGTAPGREVGADVPEVEPDDDAEVDDSDVANEVDDAPDVGDDSEVRSETSEPDVAHEISDGDVAADVDVAPPGPCDGLAEGDPCDDANACTLDDRCVSGRCLPLGPLVCDDGNVCSDDTCDAAIGCVWLANLAACDDGDPCTAGDRCSVGICRPGGETCDDRNPCTRDSCAPNGACTNTPDDALPCDDASACSAGDFCADGVCMAGPGDGCAENDPCVAVTCGADGLTCELALLNGIGCDDGDACTSTDTCQGGLCRAGPALKCPWDSECAAFRCERQTGCVLDTSYQSGKSCSDDDRCTIGESCDGQGVCAPIEPAPCDDDNPCTDDSCDATWGCEHSWVSGGCNDQSACTSDDVCEFGQCRGTALSCDDANACTIDSCDPLLGCQRLSIVCDDRNSCTTDACDQALGCRVTPRSGACDDGLACTAGDVCAAGVCKPGAVTCDDDDPCTADVCDAEEGCLNVPLAPCPVGALTITAVGVNASPSGLGQWVAIQNASAASFDLEGYAIRGERCDCEALIDESVIVAATILYGLRASTPAPAVSEIAPGGPTAVDQFDFEFGVPGDGFYIDRSGDQIDLIGPGGEVVDTFVVR